MFTKLILSAAVVTTAIAAMPAAAAIDPTYNLVKNGDFEATSGRTDNFEFDNGYAAGAGKLENWSSTGGYNIVYNASNANLASGNASGNWSGTGKEYLWDSSASPTGGRFVALDGDPTLTRAISQTITGLTVGSVYSLTFNWAAAQLRSRTGATTEGLQVTFGSDVFSTPVLSNPSMGFSGWQSATTTFTAKSSSQLLSFLSVGTPAGLPPVALLDSVKLTTAVPEPASWAMMIVGFGVVGAALGRSRRASVAFA